MKRLVCLIVTMLLGLCCFAACGKGEDEKNSAVYNLHITQNEITLSVGETVQLEATSDVENVYIFWSVRDTDIATISSDGLLTGVAEGETICYASFGGEKAMCLVKVLGEEAKPLLSVVTPYTDGITLFVGDTFNPLLSVKLGDDACADAKVSYEVSAADVVSVENGEIVALGVGEATVSVKVSYEDQTASLTLNVSVVENA